MVQNRFPASLQHSTLVIYCNNLHWYYKTWHWLLYEVLLHHISSTAVIQRQQQ